MNFILTENKNIVIGPKPWNKRAFENTLLDDLEITFELPFTNTGFFPINDNVAFYPATIIEPSDFNPKIHQYAGPFWEFSPTSATGTYTVADKHIDHVCSTLKGKIAENRYIKEISGTTTDINGTTVTVDTSRNSRYVFVHQYLIMADTDTVLWKFVEGWITLTKVDVANILSASTAHINQQFAWEISKITEIDACTTLAELDLILLN